MGVPGAEGDTGFPFRFTGQRLWAGTGLYHYKARWYHPEIGRFLQTDPIGYEDQMNLYAYVRNDPVNAIDPTGEQAMGGPCNCGVEDRDVRRERELRDHYERLKSNASGANVVTSQTEAGLQIRLDGEPGNINANEMAVISTVFPKAIELATLGLAPRSVSASMTTRITGPIRGKSRIPSGLRITDAMNDKQFTKHLKDIRQNGLENPVIEYVTLNGQNYILRGNNRFMAVNRRGILTPFEG